MSDTICHHLLTFSYTVARSLPMPYIFHWTFGRGAALCMRSLSLLQNKIASLAFTHPHAHARTHARTHARKHTHTRARAPFTAASERALGLCSHTMHELSLTCHCGGLVGLPYFGVSCRGREHKRGRRWCLKPPSLRYGTAVNLDTPLRCYASC
jgi:hypothetical protein